MLTSIEHLQCARYDISILIRLSNSENVYEVEPRTTFGPKKETWITQFLDK